MREYVVEGLELTVDGDIDVLVDAVVEWDDHDPTQTVVVTAVYPVVLRDDREEYSQLPLSYYLLSWKDVLVKAFTDKMESDWIASQERRDSMHW